MKILYDAWHLKEPCAGGGIARDANAIFSVLNKHFDVVTTSYSKTSSADKLRLPHTNKLEVLGKTLFGIKHDFNFDSEIFWLSQVLPIENKKSKLVVIRVHDIFPITNPEWFKKRHVMQMKNSFEKIDYNKTHFICNSEYTKNELVKFVGYSHLHTHILKCQISLNKTNLCFNCDGCEFVDSCPQTFILMVGTLEPRKNYQLVSTIYSYHSNLIPLVIIGRKGWKKQKYFKKLKQNKNISILNRACDGSLYTLYSKCNKFVSASLDEGFNIPPGELMQHNKIPYLSDIPVHRELYPDAHFLPINDINSWQDVFINVELKNTKQILRHDSANFEYQLLNVMEKIIESY